MGILLSVSQNKCQELDWNVLLSGRDRFTLDTVFPPFLRFTGAEGGTGMLGLC